MKTQEIISKMFSHPVYHSLEFAKENFEEGHYFLAGQILGSHCFKEDVLTIEDDFKILGELYFEIALVSGDCKAIGGALACCAHLALSLRHPAYSFEHTVISCHPVTYCMNCLVHGDRLHGLQCIGGVALRKTSLKAIKNLNIEPRATRDDWGVVIIESCVLGHWTVVGALAAAAITWEKNQ